MTIVFNRENKSLIPTPAEIRGSKPQRERAQSPQIAATIRYISKASKRKHEAEMKKRRAEPKTKQKERRPLVVMSDALRMKLELEKAA